MNAGIPILPSYILYRIPCCWSVRSAPCSRKRDAEKKMARLIR